MSGYADIIALTDAVNSGQIFSYIAKPWDPQTLKAQVGAAAVHFKLVQEVEQGRGLLRALMENSPDLIFFKDCDSRFTRVNEAQARSFEVGDAAECVGTSDAVYSNLPMPCAGGARSEKSCAADAPRWTKWNA